MFKRTKKYRAGYFTHYAGEGTIHSAKVEINEYMVACYGTTEYPEDMCGITLTAKGDVTETITDVHHASCVT